MTITTHSDIARQLLDTLQQSVSSLSVSNVPLPDNKEIDALMLTIRQIIFPNVYIRDGRQAAQHHLQDLLDSMARQLKELIVMVTPSDSAGTPQAGVLTESFVSSLPEIQTLLYSDVEAVAANDPAVSSRAEIIGCYPAITVMLHYRVAHALHRLGVALLPRIITERAHSLTGVDIHPAASIGASFGIDHGTGIVIGATAIIGNNVMVYQGVTLGAKNFSRNEDGLPLDLPRHPIIEDRVTIYSNTTILGRITIGHDSIIGGNLWITKDVSPYSRVRQSKPVKFQGFIDGEGI